MFSLDKAKNTALVRTTRRVVRTGDDGHGRLVAHEGEQMSAQEARRREIADRDLEPVGWTGRGGTPQPSADPAPQATSDDTPDGPETQDEVREALGYPQHRGGPHWLLSDGTKVQGSREDAEDAESALHDTAPAEAGDDQHTDADSDGDEAEES